MKILAVDPGYDRCGIAILEKQDGKEVVLYSNCIETGKNDPFPERLRAVGEGIQQVVEKYAPEGLAMETLYFSKNAKTAIAVAEARGVATFVAARNDLPLFEYSPGAIKIAVTGVGNADKKQVMMMIPRLVKLERLEMLDDEYDAIAVGITHLAHMKIR